MTQDILRQGKKYNDLADSIQTHTYNHLDRFIYDQVHPIARWEDRKGILTGGVGGGLVSFYATRNVTDTQSDHMNQRRDSLRSLVVRFCLPYNSVGTCLLFIEWNWSTKAI